MTVQTFLKAAQSAGLAHNHGAGGEFILVGTSKQLEALETALQGAERYVPGVMRCDACKFELTRVSLNVNVGTVTAGDSEPEPCPNRCGPLRPTTWKERAQDAERALEAWCDRATAAEKKLAEVAVPDGYKLVPLVPTDEMVGAADKIIDVDPAWVRKGWHAMLLAAPKVAVGERGSKP